MENLPMSPLTSYEVQTLRILLGELRQIKEDMQDPDNWDSAGICILVSQKRLLRSLFPMWPLYSGIDYFPVPSEDDDPCKTYATASAKDMWDRETSRYAALRWELLEFLIDTLEREIERRGSMETKELLRD